MFTEHMVLHHEYPDEMLTTAQMCFLCAHWFAVMNARSFSMAFSHKVMEAYEEQINFLKLFQDFFSSLQIKTNHLSCLENTLYKEIQLCIVPQFIFMWLLFL